MKTITEAYNDGQDDLIKYIKKEVLIIEENTEGINVALDILFLLNNLDKQKIQNNLVD